MVDLEKPMHFTKEQSEWIKQYVIIKRQEERAEIIEEIRKDFSECDYVADYLEWEQGANEIN